MILEELAPDEMNNIPPNILEKIGKKLHLQKNHPLQIIKTQIQEYFIQTSQKNDGVPFVCVDDLDPFVTVKANFEDLQVPQDHPSRKPSETFYLNKDVLLRPHTRYSLL